LCFKTRQYLTNANNGFVTGASALVFRVVLGSGTR